jgi:hypothetical protein
MSDLAKAIAEYGVLIIIAAVFLYHVITSEKRHAQETKEFTAIAASFANVMANHTNDNTQAMREFTRVMERACILLELPNKDY